MSRSHWKFDYIPIKFLKMINKNNIYKTNSRNCLITPKMVGNFVEIYNGKKYNKILITKEMIGHKLGEFHMTRYLKFWKKKK